jgi:hypothetical protein
MRARTRARERPAGDEPEPPPEGELKALLWVTVALIAAFELVWWMFERMYS